MKIILKSNRKFFIFILLILLWTGTTSAQIPGKTFKEGNLFIYTVKKGDTLFSITRKFDVSNEEIRSLNPHINTDLLKVKDTIKLNIPTDLKTHIVEKGDTLWTISKKYDYPLTQIVNLNKLPDPDYLIPGEVIIIPDTHKKVRSVLYFIKFTTTSAYLVPEERMIPVTHNFYASVVEELIKGPEAKTDTFIPTIPETKVLGLYVENGIANLNFSDEIRRANVGSASEALLLNAIANSLTEFREIKGVNILINGQSGGSIGGHIELSRPFSRNLGMVRYE